MEIRSLTPADGPAIHRDLLGDPEVAVWFRPAGAYSLEECEEMAVRKAAHRTAHGIGWSLAWEGDACLGWSVVQYCIVDGVSEVEIGWAVARSHWRRGLGTRLGQHALDEVASLPLGLRTVVAYTLDHNAASRGVMAKLAMSYEKPVELDGRSHVLYRKPLVAV